ncbi:hypothetical protein RAN3_2284 [plant metagenome]|uniref:Uncharacterized protein n=1 Tax=plant metagenome TaxID=1297885 RepID=A0A484U1T4_9ZZZZ
MLPQRDRRPADLGWPGGGGERIHDHLWRHGPLLIFPISYMQRGNY